MWMGVELETYKKARSVITVLIGAVIAYSVLQNSIFTAIVGVTIGLMALLVLRRSVAAVTHDERSAMIQNKAASATLAITTVGLAIVGLSMVFIGRQGLGDFEGTGYILAIIANFVLGLNVLMNYYYSRRLGGWGVLENKLRVLRAVRDITQEDLARELGVTRQTIHAIEVGRYDPSLELAFKLARFFESRIEEIFQYRE
jgi:putative transcriptional regulator